MTIVELKASYSRKKGGYPHRSEEFQMMKKYYPAKYEPHSNFIYAFLCFIYDGFNTIDLIKKKMRILFISSTRQVVIEGEDVDEYFQIAKRSELVIVNPDDTIDLSEEGKKLVKISYYHNLFTSHYMHVFLSERTVMFATALFLIILSILKIITGLNLSSQGMLTEGYENLTDLIKIGIIGIIGLKLKKDKVASIIIILIMMLTGGTLIWSGIQALFVSETIIPTVQSFIIGIVSIALNTGLMLLKSMVGRISGNLSLLSDSKDSQLNVRLSIGVLIGFIFAIFKIYFVDSVVGIVIAILVFKESIEIMRKIISKEEEFDITSFKVYADHIYDNRLTAYILGSIRRENLTCSQLIKNFEQGLDMGRLYYEGFADFFYDGLDSHIADKHLKKLKEGKYIDIIDEKLYLTRKGLKSFYNVKSKEFMERSDNIRVRPQFKLRYLYIVIVIILFVMLIIFAPQINTWLTNL